MRLEWKRDGMTHSESSDDDDDDDEMVKDEMIVTGTHHRQVL